MKLKVRERQQKKKEEQESLQLLRNKKRDKHNIQKRDDVELIDATLAKVSFDLMLTDFNGTGFNIERKQRRMHKEKKRRGE